MLEIPVSVKKHSAGEEDRWEDRQGFQSTKSGAGEQLLLPDCRAKARVKGMLLFTDIGINLKSWSHFYV